ncbi:MAG TPA: DoxX family protein [Gemmatimonadaceae bacterium]|nr:DoxX family protein [Gemmatimonadaceae bacterium]HRQ78558.1 DoxX family protein [Gemmatimonadaceae bacterium]
MTQTSSDSRHDVALAALRVAIGGIFAAHGAQKLFVYGIEGVSGAFGGMGIPMPGITGPLTGVVELAAGLALVVGLMARLAGLGLAVIMLGAISFVHIKAGFWAPNGVEFPLALMAGAAAIAFAGAGRYSLDAVRASR